MIENLLFIGLPYVALSAFVIGCFYRIMFQGYTLSCLSSQVLENKRLMWGSVPWHLGIIVVLLGHFFVLFFPELAYKVFINRLALHVAETIGLAAGVLSVLGMVALIYRRFSSARLRAVTTVLDIVVVVLLLAQTILGVMTTAHSHWASLWAPFTASPYILSIFSGRPEIVTIVELPLVTRAHIVGAWLLVLLIPFSRLIHIITLPLAYLTRPYIKFVWNSPRYARMHNLVKDSSAAAPDLKRG